MLATSHSYDTSSSLLSEASAKLQTIRCKTNKSTLAYVIIAFQGMYAQQNSSTQNGIAPHSNIYNLLRWHQFGFPFFLFPERCAGAYLRLIII